MEFKKAWVETERRKHSGAHLASANAFRQTFGQDRLRDAAWYHAFVCSN